MRNTDYARHCPLIVRSKANRITVLKSKVFINADDEGQ